MALGDFSNRMHSTGDISVLQFSRSRIFSLGPITFQICTKDLFSTWKIERFQIFLHPCQEYALIKVYQYVCASHRNFHSSLTSFTAPPSGSVGSCRLKLSCWEITADGWIYLFFLADSSDCIAVTIAGYGLFNLFILSCEKYRLHC